MYCTWINDKQYNLLHPIRGGLGLFFPIGELDKDGTCEFASKECLKKCSAKKSFNVPKGYAKWVYGELQILEVPEIVEDFLTVLERSPMEIRIIHWFASGDCPTALTDKIIQVMMLLSLAGVLQCGFTRNHELVKKLNHQLGYWEDDHNLISLWPTYEDEEDGRKSGRQFAFPNYGTGLTELNCVGYEMGGCGGGTYYLKGIKRKSHCCECFWKKEGCFNDGWHHRRHKLVAKRQPGLIDLVEAQKRELESQLEELAGKRED